MFPVSPTLSSDVLRKVLSSFRGGIAGVVLCSCISMQQASNKSSWRDTAKDKEEQRWRVARRSHWGRNARKGFGNLASK